MKPSPGGDAVLVLPYTPPPRPRTLSARRRLLRALPLIVLGACLTLVLRLPTPRGPVSSVLVAAPLWATSSIDHASDTPIPIPISDTNDDDKEWKDDTWPIRPLSDSPTEQWDISTSYPYPRLLEYDVSEGTWLRLDVNPVSGDIVFDMLGDLYCLPASSYSTGPSGEKERTRARARPVLLGVPHDSDPHFSPDGTKLVYRSDAELGFENIWVVPWRGCEKMDVRPPYALDHESVYGATRRTDVDYELVDALYSQKYDEEQLAQGKGETPWVWERRMRREGRLTAWRVTNETYRWVSDARFHPSGSKVVATKWYTSGRSLGAGEGWEYAVPKPPHGFYKGSQKYIPAGSGKKLVGRTLPAGWGPEDYGEQQIGPEQFVWYGNDSVIYAKNVVDTDGQWQYSKDVHSGIYAIFSTNLTTQQTTTLVSSFPGGASRPELSRDQRTLAFVRRVRDKEALVLKDLTTGAIHNIWHGLTYDLSVVSAPMGTYPSFSFTPNDTAIIIWAAGQIYHVPLTVNSLGERVGRGAPWPIGFTAHVELRLAQTVWNETDVLKTETGEKQRVHAFTELRASENGDKVVFEAAGETYLFDTTSSKSKGKLVELPKSETGEPTYSPAFVHGAEDLIIRGRWSDTSFTTLEIVDTASGSVYALTGVPMGRYYSPVLCECSGAKRRIAFIKTGGDYLSGDIAATAGAGLYVGDLTLPSTSTSTSISKTYGKIEVKNVHFVTDAVNAESPLVTKIRFLEKADKVLVQQSGSAYIVDLKAGPDEFGEYKIENVAQGLMSQELVVAPSGQKTKTSNAAIVDFFHVYFAPNISAEDAIWSKPGSATKNLTRLSLDGGHDVVFSGDGKRLVWFLGPYLHSVKISDLEKCSDAIAKDPLNFGIACTQKLLDIHEITVEYATEAARLTRDAQMRVRELGGGEEAALENADLLVVMNATVLTMDSGDLNGDVYHNAVLFTRGGKIEAVMGAEEAVIPQDAMILDAEGGFITPGFIDVHAHWNGFSTIYPAKSWEMETFLAYGVTTLHNPSADNVRGFWERFRLERGGMIGPRIFQVGDVIYGAAAPGIHQDITTMEEARSALIRIKAEGGPSSYSYKNYNLPSRASRQRLLLAARELRMLCVPEGGMNYDWDQTYIIDGMTTIEHPLPIPRLYDDIMILFAMSGTGSTPTHIVNYGGVFGEQYIWANEDIPNDEKLRRFTRHDILAGITESTARPKYSYGLFNTSESTAKMVHMGLKAHIGAHGEPPLGLNYHSEMFFARQGGLSNYEVIRAATADAAKTLGIFSAVGSLRPGKLADFLIFPPGFDLLEGDIRGTRDLKYVVRGGRVWEAATMVELWPNAGAKQTMPPLNPE